MSSTAIRNSIASKITRRGELAKSTLSVAKTITSNREKRSELSKEVKTLRADLRKEVKNERAQAKKDAVAKAAAKKS